MLWISSPTLWLVFYSIMSFEEKKFLISKESNVPIFFFYGWGFFVSCLRSSSLPLPRSWRYSLIVSSIDFIILHLIFVFYLYGIDFCEWFQVGIQWHFFPQPNVQLSQHHLLKSSYLPWWSPPPLMYIKCPYMYGSIFELCFVPLLYLSFPGPINIILN